MINIEYEHIIKVQSAQKFKREDMIKKVMKIKSSLNKKWRIKRIENKTETSMKWMIGVRSKYPCDKFVE